VTEEMILELENKHKALI
jgi:hypothetical protein